MALQVRLIPYLLQFKFDARTSRGAMQQHQVYYITLSDTDQPGITGIGECAPLPGLSLEYGPDFQKLLKQQVEELNILLSSTFTDNLESAIYSDTVKALPSLVFALETAWLDYKNGGTKKLYSTDFSAGKAGIPINGLIWMGDKSFMLEQIRQKLTEGYTCLKLKIGSLDFATELEIIQNIRQVASASELTIRVDANGAFSPAEALHKLEKLDSLKIHSIEQPIRQGQPEAMQQLCAQTPVPIALDEELIGIYERDRKINLLNQIKPQFIILKPTLLGGLRATAEWIELAEAAGIDWWITSALESNIGLNAISQFTAAYPIKMEQGLGTGQLYHNNINSPLTIRQGHLYYDVAKNWPDWP